MPLHPIADGEANKRREAAVAGEGAQAGRDPGILERTARRLLLGKLETVRTGTVRIVDGPEARAFGQPEAGLSATLTVRNPRFYRSAAFGGSVGAAESYMAGDWDCDDLVALCRIMVINGELARAQTVDSGWGRVTEPARRLFHALNKNTFQGSRENIAAHYDLGNDFFRLFLDENLMYSCAIYPREDATLEEASDHKVDRICRKLDLGPNDHLLEIGTGWGGFALHAARTTGCRITTTTISREQYDLARDRIAEAGLTGRVEVLLEDYRELRGQYDKLVSIEMIEAVGHHYFDTYFRRCGELLKPNGLFLLQAITISDWAYERARRTVDFIKRYIFPGSCIPSVAAMCDSVSRATDMRLVDLEDIGPHYARTLAAWRDRFEANLDRIRAMGFPESFIRMWVYYLCYCEGGFEERYISDVHMLLAKPMNRRRATDASG